MIAQHHLDLAGTEVSGATGLSALPGEVAGAQHLPPKRIENSGRGPNSPHLAKLPKLGSPPKCTEPGASCFVVS